MDRKARWFWFVVLIALIATPGVAGAGPNVAADVPPRGDDSAKAPALKDIGKGFARIAVALNGVFRHPEERRVGEPWTLVTVIVTSRKAISKVFLTLNGAQVPITQERRPGGSIIITAPVVLREGANPLVVSALEPNGNVQQEESMLVFDRRVQ